ncbi:hypothetical protein VP1G_10999 [Cytospora mali]|uniref:Heterokaryon incompatibility domain-containing protein n=1 Tax=Cytospora mali TaxID=578113 RepID=A0A194V4U6_CYTMA|nr:hypothetical protein VP1G_10999 [Valsa mali var. pyri (nom. inval.)]
MVGDGTIGKPMRLLPRRVPYISTTKTLEGVEEESAKLGRIVQKKESRIVDRTYFDFLDYAEASKRLPPYLDINECYDDEDSALLAITSACGDGTTVLIDRSGPTRWLDVKVLSRAYGHLTGNCLQIQTDQEVTHGSTALTPADSGHKTISDYVNISRSLMDETLLRRIRTWMAMCSTDHDICRHNINDQELPTRVIKICGPKEVRLMESRGRKKPYSCLSYCWGSGADENKVLTKARLGQYTHAIPWRALPNAVAGAIELVRQLGFRFIWVDAFCIIQDDPDDWISEAGNMTEVYGNSSLTVTNPQSDRASHDFTKRQVQACSMSVKVSGSNLGRESTTMLVPRLDCNSMFARETSPWMRRGWTFQEWLLSPRVLHCGDMVVWDCFEAAQYEDRANDRNDLYACWDFVPYVQSALAKRVFGRLRRLQIPRLEASVECCTRFARLNQLWSELVEEFTSRQFTLPKDKLPALAGFALQYMKDDFAAELGPEYLAGIWRFKSETRNDTGYYRPDFPAGLLWRRKRGSPYMNEPPSYRAPSWSWAALDGPISFLRAFRSSGEKLCLEVHEASCEYYPSGSLSSVTAGRIVAVGPS